MSHNHGYSDRVKRPSKEETYNPRKRRGDFMAASTSRKGTGVRRPPFSGAHCERGYGPKSSRSPPVDASMRESRVDRASPRKLVGVHHAIALEEGNARQGASRERIANSATSGLMGARQEVGCSNPRHSTGAQSTTPEEGDHNDGVLWRKNENLNRDRVKQKSMPIRDAINAAHGAMSLRNEASARSQDPPPGSQRPYEGDRGRKCAFSKPTPSEPSRDYMGQTTEKSFMQASRSMSKQEEDVVEVVKRKKVLSPKREKSAQAPAIHVGEGGGENATAACTELAPNLFDLAYFEHDHFGFQFPDIDYDPSILEGVPESEHDIMKFFDAEGSMPTGEPNLISEAQDSTPSQRAQQVDHGITMSAVDGPSFVLAPQPIDAVSSSGGSMLKECQTALLSLMWDKISQRIKSTSLDDLSLLKGEVEQTFAMMEGVIPNGSKRLKEVTNTFFSTAELYDKDRAALSEMSSPKGIEARLKANSDRRTSIDVDFESDEERLSLLLSKKDDLQQAIQQLRDEINDLKSTLSRRNDKRAKLELELDEEYSSLQHQISESGEASRRLVDLMQVLEMEKKKIVEVKFNPLEWSM